MGVWREVSKQGTELLNGQRLLPTSGGVVETFASRKRAGDQEGFADVTDVRPKMF